LSASPAFTDDERTRFVAVLEIPPVESAETAVRVQKTAKDAKRGIKKQKKGATLSGTNARGMTPIAVLGARSNLKLTSEPQLVNNKIH
jgi:hypothetical protein